MRRRRSRGARRGLVVLEMEFALNLLAHSRDLGLRFNFSRAFSALFLASSAVLK